MQVQRLSAIAVMGISASLVFGSVSLAGQTIITGANGKSATVQQTHQRQGNTVNRNRTTTYPNGQTTTNTRSVTGNGNGSYSGTGTRTNRQGESNQYQIEGQRSLNNGTYQNNATITGPKGGQSTLNSTGSCSSGQCSGTRILTYPDGKTRTTNTTGNRTGQGTYTGTVNTTGRNGQTRSGTIQRTP